MDRLASRESDTSLSFKPTWPITLKANVSTSYGGAIPDHDPLKSLLEAPEDVTNWDNFSYLKFSFTAPYGAWIMTYTVSGAGDESYNGTYVEMGSTIDGYPWYYNYDTYAMIFHHTPNEWRMTKFPEFLPDDNVYYTIGDDPAAGPWFVGTGEPPAPVVTGSASGDGLKIEVGYTLLAWVYDPCYTCHEHRYGEYGEFEYQKIPSQTATYDNDYIGVPLRGTGLQTFYIDLRCPHEGNLVRGALQHVDYIEISGFPVPDTGTHSWTMNFGNLELTDGPVVGTNPGETHLCLDFKRAWDWSSNFFGLAGLHDGASILAIQYGTEDYEKRERGLKYTQLQQHCPLSEATTDLTYCKDLGTLAAELSLQEGFDASFSLSNYDSRFKDADGNYLFGPTEAKWWWLRYVPDGTVPLSDACVVRSAEIVPGVPYKFHLEHFLQGKFHGLLKTAGGLIRDRSSSGPTVTGRNTETEATYSGGPFSSDVHGRWKSEPVPEDDWLYDVVVGSESSNGMLITNRSYTELTGSLVGPECLYINNQGVLYRVLGMAKHLWIQLSPFTGVWDRPKIILATASDPHELTAYQRGGVIYIQWTDADGRHECFTADEGRTVTQVY